MLALRRFFARCFSFFFVPDGEIYTKISKISVINCWINHLRADKERRAFKRRGGEVCGRRHRMCLSRWIDGRDRGVSQCFVNARVQWGCWSAVESLKLAEMFIWEHLRDSDKISSPAPKPLRIGSQISLADFLLQNVLNVKQQSSEKLNWGWSLLL